MVPPIGEGFLGLGEQVYSTLLEMIVARRLMPGERLVLDDLAVQLRVSRTPVRQALSRLAGEGLVESNGRNGWRVTTFSAQDFEHIYEMRLMCEQFAVEKALAAPPSAATLARLCGLLDEYDRLASSPDPAGRLPYLRVDHEFHRALVDLAANPRLSDHFERLNIHTHNLRAGPGPASPGEQKAANGAEHQAILAALTAGDALAAKEAVRVHIANSRERALDSLDQAQTP
ncbi:MAG: GntR family transcriptional regulator [Chloroflexota bacterium]